MAPRQIARGDKDHLATGAFSFPFRLLSASAGEVCTDC
jgi:hypothetical protein